MAGALGIRLAGPMRYDGVLYDEPWIGDGGAADATTIRGALRIMVAPAGSCGQLRACG